MTFHNFPRRSLNYMEASPVPQINVSGKLASECIVNIWLAVCSNTSQLQQGNVLVSSKVRKLFLVIESII